MGQSEASATAAPAADWLNGAGLASVSQSALHAASATPASCQNNTELAPDLQPAILGAVAAPAAVANADDASKVFSFAAIATMATAALIANTENANADPLLPLIPKTLPIVADTRHSGTAVPNVMNRQPLVLGIDVEERPMWGMDCYTRVAVTSALSQAPGYMGTDKLSAAKRDRFLTHLLMPAVHTMGKDGWDIAAALEKVMEAAAARGDDDDVGGCVCILRAVREVDERELDTEPPPPPKGGWGRKGGSASSSNNEQYTAFCRIERPNIVAANPTFSHHEVEKALGQVWGQFSKGRAKQTATGAAGAEASDTMEEISDDLEVTSVSETETLAVSAATVKAVIAEGVALEERPRSLRVAEAAVVAEVAAGEAAWARCTAGAQLSADKQGSRKPPRRSVVDRATKRRHFRLHPKGVGVVCIRPGGLEPGTYVQDYLGEIYSPWRWYERQDAIKKREPGKDLPDFFNITLERPAADAAGYDTLFVEAAHRCTFASRLSHSCAPNCHTVNVSVGGKLTIAQYTTRPIACGEELCWNYSCVTESEKEYRAAICLCSSTTCRGAFLDYSGSSAFTKVMSRRHNFLDRNALLIRACAETVTTADRAALVSAGIKSAALNMPGMSPPTECPTWLVKWAALTLQYIDLEKELLPAALMEKPLDGIRYDMPFARATAAGVGATRIQNLVITLDKIKYVLRQPAQCQAPFLRPLTDPEVVAHLWNGPHGVLKRMVAATSSAVGSKSAKSSSRGKGSGSEVNWGSGNISKVLAALRKDLAKTPSSAAEARNGLERVSTELRSLGAAHVAAADCLLLYARTRHWCTPEKYMPFVSEPVVLEPLAAKDAAASAAATASVKKLAATFKGNVENVMKKRYQPHFTWGQMVSWFKQTIYDPSASLSADRRGCMSLPDPESAYADHKGEYAKKERRVLLAQLARAPDKMWPTAWIWSFRNPGKVYGSPFIDDAIATSRNEAPTLAALLKEMQSMSS